MWDLDGRWGQVLMTLTCYVKELELSPSRGPGTVQVCAQLLMA